MKLPILATLCTASLLFISGCGVKPAPKKEATIDDTLPLVQLTKNGTIADVNAIALEWSPIEDQRVEGIYIYRVNIENAKEGDNEYYDTVESRFATHYLDSKIEPGSKYGYYFKTYSQKAESPKSDIAIIASMPPMESVTWIHGVGNMPRSAKIIWRPHVNEKVKSYILQRKTLDKDIWRDIATVNGRLMAEYIDKDLKDNFTYKYRVRALTFDDLLSKPSQEVSVITKELPKELIGISASSDLPRKIELKWEKSDVKDFLLYRVYRATSINGSYKVIADTVNNYYTDAVEEDGKEYFYRVSVFDKDRLESIHDKVSVLGKTLVKPNTPSMVEAKLKDGKVVLSWSSSDPRAKAFSVQKRYKKNFIESLVEDYENIKGANFIDGEIEPDMTYYYKVFSVDVNNIKSEPSIEIELKIPKDFVRSTMIQENIDAGRKVIKERVQKEANEEIIVPLNDFN